MATFPSWATFGLLAAFLSAAQMLLQEHFKAPGLPMAFWIKITCALVMAPFVIAVGLPTNPIYYILLVAQSLLWVVSDVIFYREVSTSGAGVISRIIPIATILSFFLWFAYDWTLVGTYAATPLRSLLIISVFCLSAGFAWRLKSCPITWPALRSIWFVLLSSIVGAVTTKYITLYADIHQGAYAYVFCEAIIMLVMWLIYYVIKRPVPAAVMFGASSIKAGTIVGVVAAGMVTATVYSVYHVDNPAYVSAVKYTDAAIILLFYRLTGRPSQGRIWPGLGIVACAAALIILKAQP